MKDARLLATVAILTAAAGLLMPPRLSGAMSQGETAAIAGNHPNIALTGWNSAPGALDLHMMAVLALRNQSELAALKTQLQQPGSANYHKWLSTAEFMRRFGPTRQQMEDVTSWLGANHFTIDKTSLATRTVRFSGTVTQVERAFSIEIVSNAGAYANISDPRVPARLAGTLVAIFGLSRRPASGGRMRLADLESADVTSTKNGPHFTPQDFWTYYDQSPPITAGNNGGTGAGDCIGLMEGAGILPVEIDTFDAQFGLPPASLTMVPTDAGFAIPYSSESHETELDVEWAHAVAPNTPIVLYVVTQPGGSAFDALNLAVTQNACGTISSSIHTCANLAEVGAYFNVESEAVVQGQTLFHASGDFGSFFACGQPKQTQRVTGVQPSIDETASSPDVTVVGGTQFPAGGNGANTSHLTPGFEQVWNTFATVTATPNPTPTPLADACSKEKVPTYGCKGGSGGGLSVVKDNLKPSWQDGFVPYGLPPSDFTQRGVPDVASVANGDEPGLWVSACFSKPCPATPPFAIKESGACPAGQHLCFLGDGGTSAGAPVWAGISRLLAQSMCATRLGNINPQLYALAGSDALVDVSQLGQNCPQAGLGCTILAGYQVGPGYDLGTGLGSADFNKLLAAVLLPISTATATSSNTKSSGSMGQTIGGGTMTLTNTGSLPVTVSTVTLNVSNPALFSVLSLSASVDGGPGLLAVSGPLGNAVTFVFSHPALTVPPGGPVVLTLSAGMAGASHAAAGRGRPGSTILGGGRSAGQMAAVLALIGLGLVLVPGGNRCRMRLFSAMFLLIAATQVGCGGDNGAAVVGTSEQSVPACGVGVSNANGAVGVTGLPATFGQVRLVN